MKRRTFLHHSLHGLATTSLFQPLAHAFSSPTNLLGFNPDNDHVLVAIFLNGGNDSLNTIVQLDDMATLNSLRPHVFIPEKKLLEVKGHPLAFHPSLVGFQRLFEEGSLKIIRAVGYENQNYSHFRSTDIWMSGADSDQVLASGWMGRYLNNAYPNYPGAFPNAAMPHPLALELGYSNSLLFQGPLANMSVVINGERDFYQLVEDDEGTNPTTLSERQLAHVRLVRRQSQVYGKEIRNAANKVSKQLDYPPTEIAGQLKIVARMIAGGLKTPMYKVEIGGFDTHAGQVDPTDTTQGLHAQLLQQVDEAVVAFLADLEQLGVAERVVGMTFSEFGRRIVSNASLGTDHGAAAPVFIFGKPVAGGISGINYLLDSAMTYADNLPYQFDFRQVYGSLLSQWLCVDSPTVGDTLLQEYEEIPIIKDGYCTVTAHQYSNLSNKSVVHLSPNPADQEVTIKIDGAHQYCHLDLLDLSGKVIDVIFKNRLPSNEKKIAYHVGRLVPGQYFVRFQSRKVKETKSFIKI